MSTEPIFFKDWAMLGRTAVLSLCAYVGFIVLLRVSGKRTLTKMNVFDFVFVVALGSTLATTILSSDTTLAQGLIASGTLILIQFVISWAAVRSERVEKFVNGEPSLLLFRGQFLREAMSRERLTEDEIRAAVRAHRLGSLQQVHAVVLETDGSLSVIWEGTDQPLSSLEDIPAHADHLARASSH
jgi:uncharacterized membrane protein YcaP (DUF421 family)